MKLIYSGKNLTVSDALKEQTEKKLGKLEKYFKFELEGKVNFENAKNRQIIEVTINLPGAILRAEESGEDFYSALDSSIDVLERQIRKHKTKLEKKYRNNDTIRFENVEPLTEDDQEKGKIVKKKSFALKPMSSDEAVLQMELLRHNFYIFIDSESDNVQIVYKRKDGNYGVIEPVI